MRNLLALLFVLAAPTLGQAQPASGSLLPPAPQPAPPKALPAPPAAANPTALKLSEVIPDWQARRDLARALSYLKRHDESLAEYRKVLAERPTDNATRQELGQVLLWAGRPAEARAELARIPAAELTPAAELALADTHIAAGDFAAAEPLYRQQLQRDPADQLTRVKLAELLSWNRRYDDSLALYREVLRALPTDVQVRRRYALVLMWAGRSDEAAAELRRTLPE